MLTTFGRWFSNLSPAEQDHAQATLNVAPMFTPVEIIPGTAHTLEADDAGKMLVTTNGASVQVTVPNEDTQQFPEFCEHLIVQGAAGLVTVVGAGGVTLLKKDETDLITNGFSGCVFLKRTGRNTWLCFGDYT